MPPPRQKAFRKKFLSTEVAEMVFLNEFRIVSPTAEEIVAAQMLLETSCEFLTDRELWILEEFGGDLE